MMSSFTTLKKNSRFKSACLSSGPVTFCEGGPGHVHMRSPAVSHAASCTNLVQESIVALHRLVPHPILPPSVRDPGHVYARSPATSTHAAAASTHAAFRCTNLCNFPLRLSRDICCSCPTVLGGAPLGHYRRYLWVSRHQTLSWASLSLGLYFSAGCISGRLH